jgi:hypothetical protein
METKYFDLKDFNRIELEGPFDLDVAKSELTEVSVTADDFPFIRVEKRDDTLVIRRQGIEWFAPFHHRPKAIIKLPAISALDISGASNVYIENFQTDSDFSAALSGASRLETKNISAGRTEVKVSGSSNVVGDIKVNNEATLEASGASQIELAGAGGNLFMKVSGASKVELSQFQVQNADVDISGASKVNINLNGRLNTRVSGASKLLWSGSPIMGDIQITGASNIRRK